METPQTKTFNMGRASTRLARALREVELLRRRDELEYLLDFAAEFLLEFLVLMLVLSDELVAEFPEPRLEDWVDSAGDGAGGVGGRR